MNGSIRQAVVLAGGRGSRLGSLTVSTPKPLLNVGDRPFLEWVLGNLARQGVQEVILTIGYQAAAFDAWHERWKEQGRPLPVTTYLEEEPLGTGGALPLILDRLHERFFVLNGDTLFDVDLDELRQLLDVDIVTGAMALRAVPDTGRYGRVTLEDHRVVDMQEKTGSGPGLINGGVYAITKEAIQGLGSPSSIERDLLPALIERRALAGVASDGFFIDIGVPETYEEAQASVPTWWELK